MTHQQRGYRLQPSCVALGRSALSRALFPFLAKGIVQAWEGLQGKVMLSPRGSNYESRKKRMQCKLNCRRNYPGARRRWYRISLTAPLVSERKYHDIHKLHRWISDLRMQFASQVESLREGILDIWNYWLIINQEWLWLWRWTA